eukprot:symbB.v1.2.028545.t1/scaffold3031.1/size66479/2
MAEVTRNQRTREDFEERCKVMEAQRKQKIEDFARGRNFLELNQMRLSMENWPQRQLQIQRKAVFASQRQTEASRRREQNEEETQERHVLWMSRAEIKRRERQAQEDQRKLELDREDQQKSWFSKMFTVTYLKSVAEIFQARKRELERLRKQLASATVLDSSFRRSLVRKRRNMIWRNAIKLRVAMTVYARTVLPMVKALSAPLIKDFISLHAFSKEAPNISNVFSHYRASVICHHPNLSHKTPSSRAMALPLGFTPLEVRTYLILTLCWVSIVVVNLLEQPYARSLIHCDVPVNQTEEGSFSGSKYCGNRLYVIDMGTHVSGKGQSLENVGRILITLFVSGFADYGRKRAALLGQFLITLSTALFAIAMFLPQGLAIPTYIIAQGLQGMSGIGILDQIVTGDVALILNDAVGVYSRKGIVSAFLMIILIPIIVYVQYAEITDFTYVWSGIVSLNTFAMILLYFFFPETLHKKEKEEEKKKEEVTSLAGVAVDEMKTFRKIVKTCIRMLDTAYVKTS